MESTIRYDFSFPSKASNSSCPSSTAMHSVSNRANYHYFNSNGTVSMPKPGSSSLLSCAPHIHNVAGNVSGGRNRSNMQSNVCYSCVGKAEPPNMPNRHHYHSSGHNPNGRQRGNQYNAGQYQHQQSYPPMNSSMSSSGMSAQQSTSGIGAPGTPKDGNCSFTFDDLKNTLSFMDDSPLVNPAQNANNSVSSNSNQLTVNPNVVSINPNGDNLSLHSGGSSSSASSAYTNSSSNSNSTLGLPKSMSNPMPLSTCSSASSLSGVSTSPVSMSSTTSGDAVEKMPQAMQRHSGPKYDHNGHHTNHRYHHHHQYHHSPGSLPLPLPLPTPSAPISSNYIINDTSALIQPVSSTQANTNSTTASIETAAKKYRFAAQSSEATCCWKGKLPPKQYKPPVVYSSKVFVGGLPWDICEADLCKEFGMFGPCRIEWTNKERYHNLNQQQQSGYLDSQQGYRHSRSMANIKQSNTMSSMSSSSSQSLVSNGGDGSNDGNNGNGKHRTSPGFAYVIYENEFSVRALVSNCIEDYQSGRDRVEYYFKISTRRVRNKEVQIIPWILADNNFATCTLKDLDPKKTVFVGNLHGTMTARDLAHIMNELFGSVVYAGIDIDKLKYPIGSGRVTFAHQQNFMRAVRAAFVDIQSSKFSKRIQIDPYLEDVQCCLCTSDKGIYFCRDFQCFNYYCGGCWEKQHSFNQMGNHKPLMRKREEK